MTEKKETDGLSGVAKATIVVVSAGVAVGAAYAGGLFDWIGGKAKSDAKTPPPTPQPQPPQLPAGNPRVGHNDAAGTTKPPILEPGIKNPLSTLLAPVGAIANQVLGQLPLGYAQQTQNDDEPYVPIPEPDPVPREDTWETQTGTGTRVSESSGTAIPLPRGGAAMVKTTPGLKTRSTIRRGSKGQDVSDWQKIISVTPDGIFGINTEKATKAWQQAHGITSDGIVGPDTWAKAGQSPGSPLAAVISIGIPSGSPSASPTSSLLNLLGSTTIDTKLHGAPSEEPAEKARANIDAAEEGA